MSNFELSICVVTMNRANQLKEALESCVRCNLPEKTEFVIIDNASTDNTEEIVRDFFGLYKYSYYYEKLPENLGVGGGRNYAFNKSSGEYFYMLDDDAVIDETDPEFFYTAIDVFRKYDKIISLSTQIYDTKWGKDRVSVYGEELYEDVFDSYMVFGGSHFLRNSFFEKDPYFGNKYGYEEIVTTMRIADAGCFNAVMPKLKVIHKPLVDRWDYEKEENHRVLISAYATPYSIRKMLYPRIFTPILFLFYTLRKTKYIENKAVRKKANEQCRKMLKEYKIEQKIKIKTVIKEYKKFGMAIF